MFNYKPYIGKSEPPSNLRTTAPTPKNKIQHRLTNISPYQATTLPNMPESL